VALSDLPPGCDDASYNSELNDWPACVGLLCDNGKAHLSLPQKLKVDSVHPTLSLPKHLDSASKLDPHFLVSGYQDDPYLLQQPDLNRICNPDLSFYNRTHVGHWASMVLFGC
jgi:hypothetical protein